VELSIIHLSAVVAVAGWRRSW